MAHFVKGSIGKVDLGWYIFYQVVGATGGAVAHAAFFGDALVVGDAASSLLDLATTSAALVGPTFIVSLVVELPPCVEPAALIRYDTCARACLPIQADGSPRVLSRIP